MFTDKFADHIEARRERIRANRKACAENLAQARRENREIIDGIQTKAARRWYDRQLRSMLTDARRVQRDHPNLDPQRLTRAAGKLLAWSLEPVHDYGYCGPDDMEAEAKADARREAFELFALAGLR